MSAFDLAADHDSLSLADQARANPLDLSQPAGFFTGMGTGAVTGVGRLLADTQRTTGLALGAVAGSFDMLTGDALKAQEKVFEHIVTPADKLSRHLAPKPEEIGMAGQLLHGLIKIGGEAVAFGAPGVLALETVGGTLDALDKGVDLQTAAKVGGVQGVATTAGVIAPMTLGATGLGMNVLYGAGIILALGIFQRGATAQIYEDAGRHDLALQFKAMDGEAMAVDAILGAAFAGGGRFLQIRGEKARADAVAEYKAKISEMLAPEHIDAALLKNEQLKMERSGMGLPADLASRDAHVANLTGAIDDLMEGRPVTMREPVGDTIPDPAAAKVQADVEEVLRPAVEPGMALGAAGPDAVALSAARPWDQANRTRRGDEWFEGARVNESSRAGFADALSNGGANLQAHGMGKERTLGGGIQNLLNMLSNGLDANRGGGLLQTAPLVSRPGEGLVGATASGSAYSDGPFMLVARPGESLTGNLSGLGAVLINQAHADIAPQIAAAIRAIRPDIIVAPYSEAGSVAKQLSSEKVGAGDTAATPRESSAAAGAVQRAPDAAPAPLPDSIKPETVIPIDDAYATTTVAEARGIITDLETAAREQETGLRAAVACFLRAA